MNLVEKAVKYGGKLAPLVIPNGLTSGTGLMNPSVFVDDDGTIMANLRHVNYTLYHSENKQRFNSRWGPLTYLHPEKDQNLRTVNYLVRLNSDLVLTDYTRVDTSQLDVAPLWEFVGLEDARLVKWEGEYYLIGVRRDTTTNGVGRMEYSKIELDKEKWTAREVSRLRIPTPDTNDSYCEKNWYPVLDKPYHFVKWTSPTEIVKASPTHELTEQVLHRNALIPPRDLRGSSHLVPWGSVYIAITHEVDLFKNYLGQKDAVYRHRLCVFDREFTLVGISQPFSFLDANVEFTCGAAVLGQDLLISFGFQDNAAFILKTPRIVVEDLIVEALNYEH